MTGSAAEPEGARARLAWLPNALTLARIALAPVILLALAVGPSVYAGYAAARYLTIWPPITAGLLAICALFDFLDGRLARALKAESAFGQRWDPIADKLVIAAALIGGAFLTTTMLYLMPATVILARDAYVSWLRAQPASAKAVTAPSLLAKWKTAVEFAALIVFFAAPLGALSGAPAAFTTTHLSVAGLSLLWLAAALSAWTGLDYAHAARRARRG